MTPQDSSLENHLRQIGSITAVEAATLYKVRSITSNIHRLRRAGLEIVTDFKRDITGQKYARYLFKGDNDAGLHS